MGSVYHTFVACLRASLRSRLTRRLLSLSILVASFDAAAAAEYGIRTDPRGNVIVTLSGPITPFDGAIFLDVVNRSAPAVIEIEGYGGDMLSATRIGVIIHERSLSTHAIGTCRSACAYIWIAGRQMVADEGVEISNHLPEATSGEFEGMPHHKAVAIFGWYLGRLNLSVEMMDAFLNLATRYGTTPNEYFDMLAFAQYWNAPVTVVPASQLSAAIQLD